MRPLLSIVFAITALARVTLAQSADWQSGVWHEPQVRYLVADMTLGGNVQLYRDYAEKERDPDSREVIRLWESGAHVVNTNEFERKWVTNEFGKDGRVMRVTLRGSNRTISGNEVLLSSDEGLDESKIRLVLAELTLGAPVSKFHVASDDRNTAEALRRWAGGVRATNAKWFERLERTGGIVYRNTTTQVDGWRVRLNSDTAYSEMNVRYFLADMQLGGARDFYHKAAESAHEKGCEEAVARFDSGVTITNLDDFERKKVDGKTLITRKGSDERINGKMVKLSTD